MYYGGCRNANTKFRIARVLRQAKWPSWVSHSPACLPYSRYFPILISLILEETVALLQKSGNEGSFYFFCRGRMDFPQLCHSLCNSVSTPFAWRSTKAFPWSTGSVISMSLNFGGRQYFPVCVCVCQNLPDFQEFHPTSGILITHTCAVTI